MIELRDFVVFVGGMAASAALALLFASLRSLERREEFKRSWEAGRRARQLARARRN